MSQSTPAHPLTETRSRPPAEAATPRFSPYPPAALRTSLFHRSFHASTPPSRTNPILNTPRSLALPSRFATPYTNEHHPSAPHNTPLSALSSSFGPHRSTPLDLSNATNKPRKNPFEKLSATDFDQFVNGLRDKVKNALDPEVERKKRREEREERQRIRDAKDQQRERERVADETANDVFGQIKNVAGQDEEDESENENLINGQAVKIDPNASEGSAREATSSAEPEKPRKAERGPVEIVLLDSDDESGDERSPNVETEPSEGEDHSESQGIDDSGDEDELLPLSSRSPTPDSVSPPPATYKRRRPAATHDRPSQIEYPSLSTSSSRFSTQELDDTTNPADPLLSSSPDASRRARPATRERSPLFRPRNEGSVSLSAPEDYDLDLERSHYSQEEVDDDEHDELDSSRADIDASERNPHSGPFDRFSRDEEEEQDDEVDEEDEEEEEEEEEEEDGEHEDQEEEDERLVQPPVSQRIKRDAFGRPIRYQEAELDGGEFEGYEEEEGFGEYDAGTTGDYEPDEFDRVDEPERATYGFKLEDLVTESVKEAERRAEEDAEVGEPQTSPANLGTIELIDSGDEEEHVNEPLPAAAGTHAPKPPAPALPILSQPEAALIDLLSTPYGAELAPSSDIQIGEALPLPTSAATTDATGAQPSSLPALGPFIPPTLPLPFPSSIVREESSYDFRTPPEAQEDLLDVDQVRVREMERLPFLQEGEGGNPFEGYDDEGAKEAVARTQDVDMATDLGAEELAEVAPKSAPQEVERDTQEDGENIGTMDESPPLDGEGRGEYFGEGVPGDEIVPGGELESEDEGSVRRARDSDEDEDSEDIGPRIPFEAKGKGKALSSPSIESDDPSRFVSSDQEEVDDGAEYLSQSSDAEDTWRVDLLYDYDLAGLERLMSLLEDQLRRARTESTYLDILQKIEDVTNVYRDKGGEVLDVSDEEDVQSIGHEEADRPSSESMMAEPDAAADEEDVADEPDRSAFQRTDEDLEEEAQAESDPQNSQARDQVLAIASQLVDLHSSSNPYPSLRVGSSSIDHPEEGLSAHFRQEAAPQPKIDDPINLPPPPAAVTNVDEPLESQQQDEELQIERVVADEQDPLEMPTGEETSVDVEMKEQVDHADGAPARGEASGLTIVDDDDMAPSVDVAAPLASEVDPTGAGQQPASVDNAKTRIGDSVDLTSSHATGDTQSPEEPPLLVAGDSGHVDPRAALEADDDFAVPTVPVSAPPKTSPPSASPTKADSAKVSLDSARAPTLSESTPALGSSPFIPLPASSTPAVSRSSGPDLSRFSSHFRYEPDGPPPPLDAPLNLPAPPPVVTNVDEPIVQGRRDEELEPELQVSNESETNGLHRLSDMVDLSHSLKPQEADDFEQPQSVVNSMVIIDDDDSVSTPPGREDETPEAKPKSIEHRSRIGATPPPPSRVSQQPQSGDTLIADGSAPPQNPALVPSSPASSPAFEPTGVSDLDKSSPPPQSFGRSSAEAASTEADEIRFDDVVEEGSVSATDSEDDEASDVEVAHGLLNPHKRLGGVLGFSGGADEVGETIVMNSSDSEEDDDAHIEQNGQAADGLAEEHDELEEVEELDLDTVRAALRKQNEEEERDKQSDQRQVSEAPSSEPISYASSDEDKADSDRANDFDFTINEDFGGGLEDCEVEEPLEFGSLEASPAPASASALRIHDVLEPGEWDPSRPIEFGTSAASELTQTARLPEDKRGDDEAPAAVDGEIEDGEPVVAVVEMELEASERQNEPASEQCMPTSADIASDVAESAAEALVAETDSDQHLPTIEVDAEVIADALESPPEAEQAEGPDSRDDLPQHSDESTDKKIASTVPELNIPPADQQAGGATVHPASDHSESGDEIFLMSRPPRRPVRAQPESASEDKQPIVARRSVASESLEVPSPVRRSSRISSVGPSTLSTDSPANSNAKGKRSRRSEEPSSAAAGQQTPIIKKPRRSGHPVKYVTDSEEPVGGEAEINQGATLRIHHHHPEKTSSTAQSSKFEPPVTRSRCHFTRLRIAPLLNRNSSSPYEFLVPACALTSAIAIETMKRSQVEDLGPVDESMHCQGIPLGGRGFDSDAAKLMDDRHPSKLVPDTDVLDVVRRIVGNEIFDEGEVELLPRRDEAGRAEATEDREEGEVEEGEVAE